MNLSIYHYFTGSASSAGRQTTNTSVTGSGLATAHTSDYLPVISPHIDIKVHSDTEATGTTTKSDDRNLHNYQPSVDDLEVRDS